MYETKSGSRAVAIAVLLMKSHNAKNIAALKKILFFVPSPPCMREILTTAIVQICDTSVETTQWLLQNPASLSPDVDATKVICHCLEGKLKSYGLVGQQPLQLRTDGKWMIDPWQREPFLATMPHTEDMVAFTVLRSLLVEVGY